MSSEPDDLLGKADALMARQHPGRTEVARHAEIPVLDEVVDLLPEDDGVPLLTEAVVPVPIDEEQIEALAAGMRDALLASLQPEIDILIEQELKDGLAPLVENVLNALRGDLQLIGRDILSRAIDRAIGQELARRKAGN